MKYKPSFRVTAQKPGGAHASGGVQQITEQVGILDKCVC